MIAAIAFRVGSQKSRRFPARVRQSGRESSPPDSKNYLLFFQNTHSFLASTIRSKILIDLERCGMHFYDHQCIIVCIRMDVPRSVSRATNCDMNGWWHTSNFCCVGANNEWIGR